MAWRKFKDYAIRDFRFSQGLSPLVSHVIPVLDTGIQVQATKPYSNVWAPACAGVTETY